ncbi:unnamed protein product [Psylliodes chrysocephalus]|uniref:Transposase domain-containing protein n=1 Tax=Psylliodes chrysocephalus TaxID=3402493 RepID=A0A9P0CVL9_9CUCU|nr:unnamed protein product [Psylliodes chrysocephala]
MDKQRNNALYCKKYRSKRKDIDKLRRKISITPHEIRNEDSLLTIAGPNTNNEFQELKSLAGSSTNQFCYVRNQPGQSQSLEITTSKSIDSNTNNELNKSEILKNFLKSWSTTSNINLVQLTRLLKGLKNIFPELTLPMDGRTLLGSNKRSFSTVFENDTQFVYLGIKRTLDAYLKIPNLKKQFLKDSVIKLIFNIDGLPLFKSSCTQMWPILCRVYNSSYKLSPFPVALYCGTTKPKNINNYLKDFISEINELVLNGIYIDNTNVQINLFCITCDAPARSYLKCIVGHNGTYGCERCHQKGTYFNRRIIYLSTNSRERTHEDFVAKECPKHHLSKTPMLKLEGIDIIKIFSLDYMHLCCIGVMRKILFYWFVKCDSRKTVRLPVNLREKISNRLRYCSFYVPSEFSRKPKTFNDLNRFKATEFRLILLYLGPVIFHNVLHKDLYDHFLLFHVALRILLCPRFVGSSWIITARELLTSFVDNFSRIYGRESCIYNVHNLLHLADDAINFNCSLNDISCFPFESFLGKLKRMLRKPDQPLAQVCKRLSENENNDVTYDDINHNFFVNETFQYIQTSYFKIKYSIFNKNDCYVFLKDGSLLKVIDYQIVKDILVGYISSPLKNFYTYPIKSKEVGVFQFKNFNKEHKCYIKLTDVSRKAMVVDCKTYYVALEILHLNL